MIESERHHATLYITAIAVIMFQLLFMCYVKATFSNNKSAHEQQSTGNTFQVLTSPDKLTSSTTLQLGQPHFVFNGHPCICCIFVSKQWLPMSGFLKCMQPLMQAIACVYGGWGGGGVLCINAVRESALKVD